MLRIALIAAVFVVCASIFQSISSCDPHWMQRGGALLTAIAAALAILEAFLEQEIHESEVTRPEDPNPFGIVPPTIVRRVQEGRWRLEHRKLSKDKVRAIILISSIAISGELLHGFGDLFVVPIAMILGFEIGTHG